MFREETRTPTEAPVTGTTPWLLLMRDDLQRVAAEEPVLAAEEAGVRYEVKVAPRSAWVVVRWPSGARAAFCVVSALGNEVTLKERAAPESPLDADDRAIELRLRSALGEHVARVELPTKRRPALHWETDLIPAVDLLMLPAPHDVLPLGEDDNPLDTHGVVHVTQLGIKGGLLYASVTRPHGGSMLYLQDFTRLNPYFEQTHASPEDTVGGTWPELGFVLPATEGPPLKAHQRYPVSDGYALLDARVPDDELDVAEQFLDLYAAVYRQLPKPQAVWRDWPHRARESLRDLTHSPECSQTVDGRRYLRAYVGEEDKPPESMVQLAVLVPLIEYAAAWGEEVPLVDVLRETVDAFYDPELGTVVRHLPGQEHLLDESSEQEPYQMDSWYLYHTYHNVGRLAELGDEAAQALFLKTIEYGIRVAHQFDYRWPVFFDLRTLEILRMEAEPDEGGENDVGAQYALVMLQAYGLTGEARYLDEATRAARALRGLGFTLGYQFNNTAFGAGALLRLWRETGDDEFRRLSHLCIANVAHNLWLWECDYGVAKQYSTFLGLPPLRHAPYLAIYEESETLAAFRDYLQRGGDDVLPAVRLILAEYCKYLTHRGWYHYPGELPRDVLAEPPKEGHLNRLLSVPLEDLYDGWTAPGTVGQEVYGAATPFVIATRHCFPVEDGRFTVDCNYPSDGFEAAPTKRGGTVTARLLGDGRCECQVRIVPQDQAALPEVSLSYTVGKRAAKDVTGRLTELGHVEFDVPGNATLRLTWRHTSASTNGTANTRSPKRRRAGKRTRTD